jgi:hypothetical protein
MGQASAISRGKDFCVVSGGGIGRMEGRMSGIMKIRRVKSEVWRVKWRRDEIVVKGNVLGPEDMSEADDNKLPGMLKVLFLLTASLAVVLIGLDASDWDFRFDGIYAWLVSPYVIFFCVSFLMKRTRLNIWVNCIASFLMLAITLLIYIDGMYIHTSSTSALIFIFVPIYLLFGIPVFMGISFLIAKRIVRGSK